MNKAVAVLCLATTCAAAPLRAEDAPGERYFALFGSRLAEADDRRDPRIDDAVGGELRFGDGARSGWGYELRAFYEQLDKQVAPEDTGNRGGAGVDAVYRLPRFLYLTLYGFAGGGFVYSDVLPGKDWVAPMVGAGLGLESGPLLRVMGGPLRLRVEGRFHYEDNRDEYYSPTEFDRSNYAETRLYAGLSWSLPPAAPAPAAGPEVVPLEPAAPEPEPADAAPDPGAGGGAGSR